MADWQKVATTAEVAVGSGKEVVVGGRLVALFNIDGQFHAMDGVCAHQGGPLAKGKLEGSVVTCPWHGWQFNVTDGKHCLNPRLCQTSFEVKIERDEVFVRL